MNVVVYAMVNINDLSFGESGKRYQEATNGDGPLKVYSIGCMTGRGKG
jgi:hypothetical protein